MIDPKLSIITINLNNAAGLLKTIESVISQSDRNFEFIVIDGASKDESPEVLKRFEKEFTWCVSEKDTGIYNAMNKGISRATGQYLIFLNSGDYLNNNEVVKNVLPLLHTSDVMSGDIDIYDANHWHDMKSIDKIDICYFHVMSLYHQATFISRNLFLTQGLYNEKFKSTGDYEFFIRTLLAARASYTHISLKICNFIADGMSNDPKFRSINMEEREKSWSLNFSPNIIAELKAYAKLKDSEELKWGRRLNKMIPF